MKIYVHIGAEKTGSTSIQSFLKKNRESLQKNRVCFPQSTGDLNHVKLVAHCEDDSFNKRVYQLIGISNKEQKDAWSVDMLEEFRQEVASVAEQTDKLVISSELFQTYFTKETELIELKRILHQFSQDIEIVVYIRRQVDAAISLFSTQLRSGGTNAIPLSESMKKARRYDYKVLLDLWKTVFGKENVSPRIYDKTSLIGQDIVTDFCSVIGIEPDRNVYQIPDPQNTSLSVVGQYLLLELNQMMPFDAKARHKRVRIIRYLEKKYSGDSCQPAFQDCVKFQQHFEGSNSQIAKEWFSRDRLFEDYDKLKAESSFESISATTKENGMRDLEQFITSIGN